MEIFLIYPHSFIDIITNSSTEIFCCSRKNGLNFIKEVLQCLINLQNDQKEIKIKLEDILTIRFATEEDLFLCEKSSILSKIIKPIIIRFEKGCDNYILTNAIQTIFKAERYRF